MLQKRKLCLKRIMAMYLSKSLRRKYGMVGNPKAGQYLCSQLVSPESTALGFADLCSFQIPISCKRCPESKVFHSLLSTTCILRAVQILLQLLLSCRRFISVHTGPEDRLYCDLCCPSSFRSRGNYGKGSFR